MSVPAPTSISSYAAVCSASWTSAMLFWTKPWLFPAVRRALRLDFVGAGGGVTARLTAGGSASVSPTWSRRVSWRLIAIAMAGSAAVTSGLTALGLGPGFGRGAQLTLGPRAASASTIGSTLASSGIGFIPELVGGAPIALDRTGRVAREDGNRWMARGLALGSVGKYGAA